MGLFDDTITRTIRGIYIENGDKIGQITLWCRIWLIGELASPSHVLTFVNGKVIISFCGMKLLLFLDCVEIVCRKFTLLDVKQALYQVVA